MSGKKIVKVNCVSNNNIIMEDAEEGNDIWKLLIPEFNVTFTQMMVCINKCLFRLITCMIDW